jgi:chloramphenicol-sensitive protein RarD
MSVFSSLLSLSHECTAKCSGTLAGLGAHILWGFAVLFWPLLTGMHPISIMAHRMIWTVIFLGGLLLINRQYRALREIFNNKRILLILLTAAILLGINWSLYIWAVTTGKIIESSLGYFITPLLNVLMGRIFLKEQLSRPQAFSILIAFSGVTASVLAYGHFPWLGCTLALSFALYGYVQKTLRMGAAVSLFVQTLLLFPASFLWLALTETGLGIIGYGVMRPLLLVSTIVFTGMPLLLFGYAARRITLATIGILQYVSPSLSFLLAVFIMNENMKPSDIISFPAIWIALAIYTWDAVHHLHRMKENI